MTVDEDGGRLPIPLHGHRHSTDVAVVLDAEASGGSSDAAGQRCAETNEDEADHDGEV